MSQIGKKPIEIPEEVKIKIDGQSVTVSGPKGQLSRLVRPEVVIKKEDDRLILSLKKEDRHSIPFWGTERALLQNMVRGVSEGFEKKLRLEGVGYRASMEDDKLNLKLGFSHDVQIEAPENIEFDVKKKMITVSGADKARVNYLASRIRAIRPPDAYTGKGVRYDGEVVRLKAGKKAIGTE